MKKLINAGGNLHLPDKKGNTPLHMTNFTEAQADSFLQSNASPFTRDNANWCHSQATFRDAIDELVGESTLKFIPTYINLPAYKPKTLTFEQKEYEKRVIIQKNKIEIEEGLRFCSQQSNENSEHFSKHNNSIFITKLKSTSGVQDQTKDNTNNSNIQNDSQFTK